MAEVTAPLDPDIISPSMIAISTEIDLFQMVPLPLTQVFASLILDSVVVYIKH